MRENEFERGVQEQFEDLHLRPSASVWTKVERELQRKKRRRVAFYISILAGICLLGYFSFTSLTGSKNSTAPLVDQQQPASAGNEKINNEAIKNEAIKNETIKKAAQDAENNTVSEPAPAKSSYSNRPSKSNTKNQMVITQTAPRVQTNIVREEENQETTVAVKPVPDKEITSLTPVIVDGTPAIDSVKKDSAIAKTDLPEPEEAKEPVIATAKKSSSKKIRWGFDVSAGINFSRDKAIALPGNVMSADFNQATSYYYTNGPLSSGSGGGQFANPPVTAPSPVEASRGFKVGLAAEIQLTERSKLLTGLRYSYLSETIYVGATRSTVRVPVYRSSNYGQPANVGTQEKKAYIGPQVNMYRNIYHFLELPVSYQLQLNKGKKMQLLWNGGFSASYMVASNALMYDTAAWGIYYRNTPALNKLHFNLISGLSFRFGDKNKMQWSVGPEFSMDMSPLLNHDAVLKKRYLLYGGLTARFLLPGKKK